MVLEAGEALSDLSAVPELGYELNQPTVAAGNLLNEAVVCQVR